MVSTGTASNIQLTSADVSGYIYNVETEAIQHGHCYAKATNPTVDNLKTELGTPRIGNFTSNLSDLEFGKKYYVKAYISNGNEVVYGNEINFTTATTVTDADGNIYNIVPIGTQFWIKENLKTTKLNDETSIPLVTDNTAWLNLITPGYCWYNNDVTTYKDIYGALYNWYAVNTGKLCPTGWHVPTDNEWMNLIEYLGGEQIAGGKLKEVGTAHWLSPNTGATNQSNFDALPSGDRIGADGSFYSFSSYAIFWSSDQSSLSQAINRVLVFDGTNFRIGYDNKTAGFSVRCMKD
jgi:uncharacterized protein (TIGR02145 family)